MNRETSFVVGERRYFLRFTHRVLFMLERELADAGVKVGATIFDPGLLVRGGVRFVHLGLLCALEGRRIYRKKHGAYRDEQVGADDPPWTLEAVHELCEEADDFRDVQSAVYKAWAAAFPNATAAAAEGDNSDEGTDPGN